MTDLAWNKALRVWGMSNLFPDERAAGWPDAFPVVRIGCLQYPREGTEAEKLKANKNRHALIAAMSQDIEAGRLAATRHSRTITSPPPPVRRVARSSYLSDLPGWSSEFSPRITPPPPPPITREETWYTVTRAAFRDWLAL